MLFNFSLILYFTEAVKMFLEIYNEVLYAEFVFNFCNQTL